jgi:hypothetical protein
VRLNQETGRKGEQTTKNDRLASGYSEQFQQVPLGSLPSHGRGRRFDPCIAHHPVLANQAGPSVFAKRLCLTLNA